MAGSNTEKPMGKAESKKTAVATTPKVDKKQLEKMPVQEEKKIEDKTETQKEETKPEEKKKKVEVKKVKKSEAIVNAYSVPISTKYSIAVCRFVKNKRIDKAIEDLEMVIAKKKAVPMRGEYAHQRGKNKYASGAGKFPKIASEHFINILKTLKANAEYNQMDEPIISEAVANFAARPLGRFGRHQKKRTHIQIKCVEKSLTKINKKAKENKEKKK